MGAQLSGKSLSRGRRRARSTMSEINVTPMVDVMLVLLIVFMVAAPLLTVGVPVDLPKADAPAIAQEDTKPLEVTIDNQGAIWVGETQVESLENMVALLTAVSGENPDVKIYVNGYSETPYRDFAAVMGSLQLAGFTKLNLVMKPKDSQ